MVLGRHSGRAALVDRLQAIGFALDEPRLNAVFAGFKALAEKKREVFDADLEALVLGADARAARGHRLIRAHVSTGVAEERSEEHTSELQSLMRISYAVFCLTNTISTHFSTHHHD